MQLAPGLQSAPLFRNRFVARAGHFTIDERLCRIVDRDDEQAHAIGAGIRFPFERQILDGDGRIDGLDQDDRRTAAAHHGLGSIAQPRRHDHGREHDPRSGRDVGEARGP